MKKNTKCNFLRIILATLVFIISISLISCGKGDIRSIMSTEINESGELIITYSDGTVDNLGVVVGSDGADGKDGADGADGADGKDASVTDDSDEVKLAVANALRSIVSVVFKDAVEDTYDARGSGVIYKLDKDAGDAFVITNYHVVYDSVTSRISDNIYLFIYGSEYSDFKIKAEYVDGSFDYDIAVLKVTGSEVIKNSHVSAAEIRSSSEMVVGDRVVVVGNPLGYGISSSSGIISVTSENLDIIGADDKTEIIIRVMRTDASINGGNSGGGLFDSEGRLIGIVNAKIMGYGVDNIGYAIPFDTVKDLVNSIIYNIVEKQ